MTFKCDRSNVQQCGFLLITCIFISQIWLGLLLATLELEGSAVPARYKEVHACPENETVPKYVTCPSHPPEYQHLQYGQISPDDAGYILGNVCIFYFIFKHLASFSNNNWIETNPYNYSVTLL